MSLSFRHRTYQELLDRCDTKLEQKLLTVQRQIQMIRWASRVVIRHPESDIAMNRYKIRRALKRAIKIGGKFCLINWEKLTTWWGEDVFIGYCGVNHKIPKGKEFKHLSNVEIDNMFDEKVRQKLIKAGANFTLIPTNMQAIEDYGLLKNREEAAMHYLIDHTNGNNQILINNERNRYVEEAIKYGFNPHY